MVNINLIDVEKSDIKYVTTTFPDGEPHITLDEINRKENYKVICRITNPTELFLLAQVGDILNRQCVIWELDIFYLMSMRMDRVINLNEAFSLKIVADTINAMQPSKVRIYHCHSERAFLAIRNSIDMEKDYNNALMLPDNSYTIICYPDDGANKRYNKDDIYPCIHKEQTIVMKKERDLNNKGVIKDLTFSYIGSACKNGSKILISDDLCDAGGTFCWAAKILKEKYPNSKIGIFVRHLVNPIGLKKLSETFDDVFITNSYKNWNKDIEDNKFNNIKVIDVIGEMYK